MTKSTTRSLVFAAIAAVLMLCGSNARAQRSIDGSLDIAELMAIAKAQFDLTNEDAVILYDGQRVEWAADGRLTSRVNRIIWINTAVAAEEYGDHRVPYDHANCTMKVDGVRTWRDGQWWVTGPTGVVETLPFEVDEAYDYTNVREMMMLHDGIELPCILEVSYSIEDRRPFRKGAEGLWTFKRDDPVVRSAFVLSRPEEIPIKLSASEDVPAASVSETGLSPVTYRWIMGPLDAIGRPHTDDPAEYVPHVKWSTWESWSDYGGDILSMFRSGVEIDEMLKHRIDSVVDMARTDGEKADLIAQLIDNTTRLVDYPEHYWFWSARKAARTYSTAYGHRLDRAILAAALFEAAALQTCPMFASKGYGDVVDKVPTLARMDGIGVRVSGQDLQGYYDPRSSKVIDIPAGLCGRTIWTLPAGGPEWMPCGVVGEINHFDISIDLKYDADAGMFVGTGCFSAEGCFNPLAEMQGLADEAKSYLSDLVSSIVDGAEVTAFNPSRFDDQKVVVGFELELKKPELDDYDRIPLKFGQPSTGIAGMLPGEARLSHQQRTSPVYLPSAMSQKVRIRLDPGELEVVYRPADRTLSNRAGDFAIAVTEKDSAIVIERQVSIKKAVYDAGEWPDLRSLLLADQHERNQTMILREAKSGEDDEK